MFSPCMLYRFFLCHLIWVTFSSVQSLSCVWLFSTPWIAAHQASLSITNSPSLPKLMCIELVKLTKTKHKERILKAAREKQQVTYKGNPIHLTADLPAETLQARREWHDIFKVLKGKNLQPRLLYWQGSHSKLMEKQKAFSDKQVKRIQYHQTSFTTNVKGTYTLKKCNRRKKIEKINPKHLSKWQ